VVSALVVVAGAALVAMTLLGAVFALRGRGLDLGPIVLAAAAEVVLLVQLVVVVVRLAGGDRPESPALVVSYLIAALLILPVAVFWALGERSRWSNAILAVAGGGVLAMVVRLWDLWPA
jgi:Mg2+/Co2+ transporter CorB